MIIPSSVRSIATPSQEGKEPAGPICRPKRTKLQKSKDFVTFPLRAFALFDSDRWGFSALSSERYDYVAREVTGYCLDVGCGRHNRFVREFILGNGKGVDVYAYEGLDPNQVFADLEHFPFCDASFDSVTFIACLNHVPSSKRDTELKEAFRCLKPGGNLIVTMGNPIAEILVHQIVYLYDKLLGTRFDVDTERGMGNEEQYYLTDSEIRNRISGAGFKDIRKKYFLTQWGLNHLFVAWKT